MLPESAETLSVHFSSCPDDLQVSEEFSYRATP